MGIGDWDWGPIPNPQSHNPQSPIPNPVYIICSIFISLILIYVLNDIPTYKNLIFYYNIQLIIILFKYKINFFQNIIKI